MSNTNLTKEMAWDLIKMKKVICPCCEKAILVSRYRYKYQNVEYKCPNCKEIYHPVKLV